jgi:hypothetical protein
VRRTPHVVKNSQWRTKYTTGFPFEFSAVKENSVQKRSVVLTQPTTLVLERRFLVINNFPSGIDQKEVGQGEE